MTFPHTDSAHGVDAEARRSLVVRPVLLGTAAAHSEERGRPHFPVQNCGSPETRPLVAGRQGVIGAQLAGNPTWARTRRARVHGE